MGEKVCSALYIGDNGNWFVGTEDTGIMANGYSAYEIAKDYGFQGSQFEWLNNLKGETGEAGSKEEKGDRSPKGDSPNLSASRHVTVKGFSNGITGSASIVKYGYLVMVTAALSTSIQIANETLLLNDNALIQAFGIPEHDFHCALSYVSNTDFTVSTGTMSMSGSDNGLRVTFPKKGTYKGTLLYCTKQ